MIIKEMKVEKYTYVVAMAAEANGWKLVSVSKWAEAIERNKLRKQIGGSKLAGGFLQ